MNSEESKTVPGAQESFEETINILRKTSDDIAYVK